MVASVAQRYSVHKKDESADQERERILKEMERVRIKFLNFGELTTLLKYQSDAKNTVFPADEEANEEAQKILDKENRAANEELRMSFW